MKPLIDKTNRMILGLFLMITTLMSWSSPSEARLTWGSDRYESKSRTRWTVYNWLDSRERAQSQDFLQAVNSGAPLEFYASANYQLQQRLDGTSFQGGEVALAAFASIFGLELRYEEGLAKRFLAAFNMRVIGNQDQGSHLTLQMGVRNEGLGRSSFRNAFVGASTNIYLASVLGLEGLGRYYLNSTPREQGDQVTGFRYQAGVFLDFRFVRVYADYFRDESTHLKFQGLMLGARLYY